MLRIISCSLALFALVLVADAQDVKLVSFTGRIADVNLDAAKKVESLYVQVGKQRRNVRLTEKTKITWFQIKEADQQLKVGQNAAVTLNPENNEAITIKVTAGAKK